MSTKLQYVTGRSRTSGRSPRGAKHQGGKTPRGRSTKGGGRSATDVGVLVDEGGCHRVPWATTVTVSVVRSAERWLVDSASAGTSRWTADDARGGWSMSPARGPLGGALMMV
jgi:hypothetical protein